MSATAPSTVNMVAKVEPTLSQHAAQAESDRRLAPQAMVVALLSLLIVFTPSVRAQNHPKVWTPPTTPDGRPDLQGIWVSRTATPLERPQQLEGKAFLTDD